jgi:hypothetical protein
VDPSVEAAQARLEAMRHGKFMKIKLKKKRTSPEESLDKSIGKAHFCRRNKNNSVTCSREILIDKPVYW